MFRSATSVCRSATIRAPAARKRPAGHGTTSALEAQTWAARDGDSEAATPRQRTFLPVTLNMNSSRWSVCNHKSSCSKCRTLIMCIEVCEVPRRPLIPYLMILVLLCCLRARSNAPVGLWEGEGMSGVSEEHGVVELTDKLLGAACLPPAALRQRRSGLAGSRCFWRILLLDTSILPLANTVCSTQRFCPSTFK